MSAKVECSLVMQRTVMQLYLPSANVVMKRAIVVTAGKAVMAGDFGQKLAGRVA